MTVNKSSCQRSVGATQGSPGLSKGLSGAIWRPSKLIHCFLMLDLRMYHPFPRSDLPVVIGSARPAGAGAGRAKVSVCTAFSGSWFLKVSLCTVFGGWSIKQVSLCTVFGGCPSQNLLLCTAFCAHGSSAASLVRLLCDG